jgi:hypothetical protein
MLWLHYYAIAGAGVLLTVAWLLRPGERTQITALGAFFAWGLTALLGGNVEVYADAGGELQEASDGTYHAVATGEELVAAPVPDEIRLFAALWAILSGLALVLYVWGVYPPGSEEPVDTAEVDPQ